MSASSYWGVAFYGLPSVTKTHDPWIQIGTRILGASIVITATDVHSELYAMETANATEELYWYTAQLVDDVTTWMRYEYPKDPVTQWHTGDQTQTVLPLDVTAATNTLTITCITDPDIAHDVEWIENYHYSPILNATGDIVSVTTYLKWYIRTTYRLVYTPAD